MLDQISSCAQARSNIIDLYTGSAHKTTTVVMKSTDKRKQMMVVKTQGRKEGGYKCESRWSTGRILTSIMRSLSRGALLYFMKRL